MALEIDKMVRSRGQGATAALSHPPEKLGRGGKVQSPRFGAKDIAKTADCVNGTIIVGFHKMNRLAK